jgi:hypothetical protein
VKRSQRAAVLPPETADLPLTTVDDAVAALAMTVNQVRRGEVDAKVANAVGYLVSVLLRGLEGGSLERELAELRRQVMEMRNRGTGNDEAGGGEATGAAGAADGGGEPVADGVAAGPEPDLAPVGVETGPVADGVAPLFQ